MKKYYLLLIVFMTLVSCSKDSTSINLDYKRQVSMLVNEDNYTIYYKKGYFENEEIIDDITNYYAGDLSRTLENGNETIYEKGELDTTIYVLNDDPKIWIHKHMDSDDHFYYGYKYIERLKKIGGFVDKGEIVFNDIDNTYHGSNLSGTYIFEDESHTVLDIIIKIKDGEIKYIKEIYANNGIKYFDEIKIDDIGITSVEKPIDSINFEDIANSVSNEVLENNN